MSATNRRAVRVPDDFYVTPPWVTRAILPHLPQMQYPLDPAAGDGAILRELTNAKKPRGFELSEPRAQACRDAGFPCETVDALDLETPWGHFDGVIMNPPFSRAQEFVERAIAEAWDRGATVAALLRLAFLESKKRARFHIDNASDVFVLSKRPSYTGGSSTDSCAYAWFVWGPCRGGYWRILDATP